MKTNTELLMSALGWQGGTVHQVAQVTGLKVMDILDLDKDTVLDVYQLEDYNDGYLWAMSGKGRLVPQEKRGNKFFWLGAADAVFKNS